MPAWKLARTFGAAMAIAPRSMARARLGSVTDRPRVQPFLSATAPETLPTFEVDRAAPGAQRRPAMGRHALRAVTSADVAALLPPARASPAPDASPPCASPRAERDYLGDDEGAVVACRVVRGMANAGGELGASVRVDAVANVVDDDIVNHAPFEDADRRRRRRRS